YHNMPHDPKLQVVAKRCSQPMAFVVAVWVCILDAASQHDPRGVIEIDPEEVAVIQGIELEAVEAILDALKSKNLIDDEGAVVNWHKRQHTTSTERVKKHRDGKKRDVTPRNTKKRDVTAGNAKKRKNDPDTDADTETDSDAEQRADTDSKKDSNSKNRTREEKKESEEEKQQSCGKDAEKDKKQILQQMTDIWNEEVQSKITPDQKAILTKRRKEQLAARWVDEFAEDIRAWRYFCEIIGRSEFCLGKIEGKDWVIDLTWATQSSDRVAKILEGGFSGGKHPSKPPSCDLPEFADAWDDVLKHLAHHHGKAAVRSWFSNTVITAAEVTPDGTMLTLQAPREFVRGWIEKHFLADLNHYWRDCDYGSRPVIGTQLKTKEAAS
ncbi:MAG: hypothetical protein KC496_02705, partial [Anaerolineae bacterium]|nr:hypothetical protein [Anaerolineae bacterium]